MKIKLPPDQKKKPEPPVYVPEKEYKKEYRESQKEYPIPALR